MVYIKGWGKLDVSGQNSHKHQFPWTISQHLNLSIIISCLACFHIVVVLYTLFYRIGKTMLELFNFPYSLDRSKIIRWTCLSTNDKTKSGSLLFYVSVSMFWNSKVPTSQSENWVMSKSQYFALVILTIFLCKESDKIHLASHGQSYITHYYSQWGGISSSLYPLRPFLGTHLYDYCPKPMCRLAYFGGNCKYPSQ